MREILFKAKRKDNGEWAEGYLAKGKWYLDEKEIYAILPLDLCFYPNCEINEWIEIDPETLCRYTGLTNKNGKKIWENDICSFKRGKNYYIGKIVWNKKTAAFEMWFDVTVGAYGEKATKTMLLVNISGIEVIGNIFDNPELLEK